MGYYLKYKQGIASALLIFIPCAGTVTGQELKVGRYAGMQRLMVGQATAH